MNINEVKLATELADIKLFENLTITYQNPDITSIVFKDINAEVLEYKEDIQKEFDILYDFYYDLIVNCKE